MQYFEGLNIRQEGGDIKCGQPHSRKEAERRLGEDIDIWFGTFVYIGVLVGEHYLVLSSSKEVF